MKTQGIKTLYRLFAYLSDRTNGFRPFVHYKLMLGALLISLTANACKGKPTPAVPVADPEPDADVLCYEAKTPAMETDTVSATESDIIYIETETYENESIADIPILDCYIVYCYVPPPVEEYKEDSNGKVYLHSEEPPSFPDGEKALLAFIKENYHYPEICKDINIDGRIYVRFIVRTTGEIDSVQVIRGLSPDLDSKAIQMVESMPCWIPGRQNGKAVDVYYTIPIRLSPFN